MPNMSMTKLPMPEQDPKVRATNFEEVCYGYNKEEAMEEARFFASKIKGKEIDCRLAMDFERFGELSKNEINKVRSSIYERII